MEATLVAAAAAEAAAEEEEEDAEVDVEFDVETRKEELRKHFRYGLPTTLSVPKMNVEEEEVVVVTVDEGGEGGGVGVGGGGGGGGGGSGLDGKRKGCSFDWTFGVTLTKWATFIAVIDIVKGTFGLIFAAYLAASIFRLMTETPDFEDLKRRMAHTEFVYIFAYGVTSWGVVLTVCGISFWNFFLIVFGKILYDATNQRSVGKLRLWYGYTIFSFVLFLVIYVHLLWAAWSCEAMGLCQSRHNTWVWLFASAYYFLSLFPTLYSLAIVQSMTRIIVTTLSALSLRHCHCSSSSFSTLNRAALPAVSSSASLRSQGQGQGQGKGQCHCQRSASRTDSRKRSSKKNKKKNKSASRVSLGESAGAEPRDRGGKENAYKNSSFQPPIPPPPPNPHWNQLSQNESPSYKQTQVILPLNYYSTVSRTHSYRHHSQYGTGTATHTHGYAHGYAHGYTPHSISQSNHHQNNYNHLNAITGNFNYNTWSGMSEKERERNRRSLNLSIQKQLEMEDEEHLAQALC